MYTFAYSERKLHSLNNNIETFYPNLKSVNKMNTNNNNKNPARISSFASRNVKDDSLLI